MDQIKIGAKGTRMWSRGEILWAANTGLIITSGGVILAGLIDFKFILVPLMIAYFFVFLFAPIMDLFNKTLKLGPGLGVLCTIGVVGSIFGALGGLVAWQVGDVLSDPSFMDKLGLMEQDMYSSLNDSGIGVIQETDTRYTMAEVTGILTSFNDSLSYTFVVLMIWIYIMSEKTEKKMFSGDTGILPEIETMTTGYIGLKTKLSLLTGVLTGAILGLLGVRLAALFGILAFVLNYIPNVGSMIAMFLPMPIVLVDDSLSTVMKVLAFILPGGVQAVIGNVVEPAQFGKLLNMTPMSILFALLFWSAIWGILGAILSVPVRSAITPAGAQ